jgi:hypothetical protein
MDSVPVEPTQLGPIQIASFFQRQETENPVSETLRFK